MVVPNPRRGIFRPLDKCTEPQTTPSKIWWQLPDMHISLTRNNKAEAYHGLNKQTLKDWSIELLVLPFVPM